jgi:hypothetical protein
VMMRGEKSTVVNTIIQEGDLNVDIN